jgi:hypothetical protein
MLKELEGATIERTYFAVPSRDWLPVIGDEFDTYPEARAHAENLLPDRRSMIIVHRIVARKTNGVTVDFEVDRDRLFR